MAADPEVTAITTSPISAPSRLLTRSEWVSTLPPWRRLLATLYWRSVYDIEQRTRQHELNALVSEKRMQQSVPIPPRRHRPQPASTE